MGDGIKVGGEKKHERTNGKVELLKVWGSLCAKNA